MGSFERVRSPCCNKLGSTNSTLRAPKSQPCAIMTSVASRLRDTTLLIEPTTPIAYATPLLSPQHFLGKRFSLDAKNSKPNLKPETESFPWMPCAPISPPTLLTRHTQNTSTNKRTHPLEAVMTSIASRRHHIQSYNSATLA